SQVAGPCDPARMRLGLVGRRFDHDRNIGRAILATRAGSCAFLNERRLTTIVHSERQTPMMTLCIRYTLDVSKLADFEAYAQSLRKPIERCGGTYVDFFLPTKIAGPTNAALGLIDFPSLAAYEAYRAELLADPGAVECLRRAEM